MNATKRFIAAFVLITAAALGFRLFLALRLPNDEPDDGRAYAQIARNVLDRHIYSIETSEPYKPTYIRVPGYPLFLAGVYRVFGRDNNKAVRVIQTLISTLTCIAVGLLAFCWTPAKWPLAKRRRALLAAVALAAACPFTAIYVSVILTETWATCLAVCCVLAATLALKSGTVSHRVQWWGISGFLGGFATMFRPDAAMFAGAAGVTMVLLCLIRGFRERGQQKQGSDVACGEKQAGLFRTFRLAPRWKPLVSGIADGLVLSGAFALALLPWTARNARVFHVFQPIAPIDATMPGDFAEPGYLAWLKTWVDDVRFTETVEWPVDHEPIRIDQMPAYAFDSPDEKARVAALLDRYNNGADKIQAARQGAEQSGDDDDDDDDSGSGQAADDHSPTPGKIYSGPDYDVEMTPEIDAGFMQIARERIARHPFRYYFGVRFKRAISLWFDTHSQYYPFQGELLPLSDLDPSIHQQFWLPAFMLITILYTAAGLAGCALTLRTPETGRWLLLLGLVILPRIAFLSTLENPEPRYVVELFTFVAAAAAVLFGAVDFDRKAKLFSGRARRHQLD